MTTYQPEWDLTTIPQHAWRSESGRRASAARKTKSGGRNGGRPGIPTVCECGLEYPSRGAAMKCRSYHWRALVVQSR